MNEQLQARLEALKGEYEIGQARLKELDAEATYVRETMLRISGSIQVLEEMLSDSSEETALKIGREGADTVND